MDNLGRGDSSSPTQWTWNYFCFYFYFQVITRRGSVEERGGADLARAAAETLLLEPLLEPLPAHHDSTTMPSLLSIVTTLLDPLIDIGAYVLTLLAALVPPTRRRQGASRALGIEIKLAGGSQAFSKWLPDVPLGTLADRTFLPQLAARIRRGLYSFSRAIAVWFIKEAQANLAISDAEYAKLVTPRKPARRPSLDWLGDFVPQVEFERDGPFRRAWDLQGNERQARRSRWTSERAPPLKLRRRWSWPSGQHAGEDWLGEQTSAYSSLW